MVRSDKRLDKWTDRVLKILTNKCKSSYRFQSIPMINWEWHLLLKTFTWLKRDMLHNLDYVFWIWLWPYHNDMLVTYCLKPPAKNKAFWFFSFLYTEDFPLVIQKLYNLELKRMMRHNSRSMCELLYFSTRLFQIKCFWNSFK